MKYDILVNKNNALSCDFVPDNLVRYLEMDSNEDYKASKTNPNYKNYVEKYALFAFFKMQSDASKQGYIIVIDSAYRSYYYQKDILLDAISKYGDNAYNTVARPGTSEHQTGLAIDIAIIKNGKYCDDITEDLEEVKWVFDNCYKYGFIIRYPKNTKEITGYNFEPWHIRYVGTELSRYMKEENINTLEEYHERIKCRKL